jgi:hypothetical protein
MKTTLARFRLAAVVILVYLLLDVSISYLRHWSDAMMVYSWMANLATCLSESKSADFIAAGIPVPVHEMELNSAQVLGLIKSIKQRGGAADYSAHPRFTDEDDRPFRVFAAKTEQPPKFTWTAGKGKSGPGEFTFRVCDFRNDGKPPHCATY